MPRVGRLDAPGVLHHVMTRGIERGLLFRDRADYTSFLARLGTLLKESQTSCYAWALMPNHLHLLLVTGTVPLSVVMQRLLTGHAGAYNRRWRRSGHLFQNRYKSLLCETEPYLKELVRYVHLNPVRAGLCEGMSGLARYPWTGHRAVLGLTKTPWQDTAAVLDEFGSAKKRARETYITFCTEGLNAAPDERLIGQGLRRLVAGGWELIQGGRGRGEAEWADERLLGSQTFVERILEQADQTERIRSRLQRSGLTYNDVVKQAADAAGLKVAEVQGSGKRPPQVRARALACHWLVERLGLKEVEVARRLGITQPAVSQNVTRGRHLAAADGLTLSSASPRNGRIL